MALMNGSDYEELYREMHEAAVPIAGCFAMLALVFSMLLIFQHLTSYTNPREQKLIIAVLFMVPVYATESVRFQVSSGFSMFVWLFLWPLCILDMNVFQFISLWNPRLSNACDILRNCYEAFTLYSFGSYLVACLGGERRVIELLEHESKKKIREPLLEREDEKPDSRQRSFGNFFTQPYVLGKDLFSIIKFGLVQYMILKTFCAFLALFLELFGIYGDGEFKWYYGSCAMRVPAHGTVVVSCSYPYMAVVLNFSQMWALFYLVQFYNATHERLKSMKPLAKFISFKAIVFATWWQGVGIALLCAFGVLPSEGKIRTGLQDFLICIEMAIAAIAHVFIFSAKPYHYLPASEYRKKTTQTSKEELKLEDDDENPAAIEETETEVKAPGTSVKESVQDIVLEGGQTYSWWNCSNTGCQGLEPVEKGVMKMQETFHLRTVGSNGSKDVSELEVEEDVKSCGN
ncbi:Organic solute transporter subunit alpha/Transmembrane protein 184 [Dillenia turbinata]|uniref:Organic solute transporter subunit alpha/Transmembrane protein 184 n=1 Tax=Dillenia turbinata TaxID=194707 RepID=A0AAN8WAI3_9MAGN